MGGCVASALPCKSSSLKGEVETVQSAKMAGRVPGVTVSVEAVQMEIAEKKKSPSPLLEAVMAGRSMDMERARAIAKHIAKPDYTLGQYFQDLMATFPELHLFGLEGMSADTPEFKRDFLYGGRVAGDEFQRTIGAFFAIYWLVRANIDGKHGFCHGVDDSWRPMASREGESDKCRVFYGDDTIWNHFHDLMLDAGILVQTKGSKLEVDCETILALLVLTALHDVMKVSLLLPVVAKADAPYRGYGESEVVADHDMAIFYLIERYPQLLPSLSSLKPDLQSSVRMVLSGLAFNNGWFVQAEAPPGAVLRGIKAAITSQNKSDRQLSKRDLSLYFVHWLTDLAGAEPSPLLGCLKLTSQLPLPVLKSFMESVKYIQQLADRTETEVMESYLKDRWRNAQPPVGPLPAGPEALVKTRLLCMAQGMATQVLEAFDKLSDSDKEVLSVEMARTGTENQSFSEGFVPASVRDRLAGPAFLVYYGPAFLQRMNNDSPVRRLEILAEIYRRARKLWPAASDQAGNFVTLRIDAITIQGKWSSRDPELLLLRMCSNKQAVLERKPGDPKTTNFKEENTEVLFAPDVPNGLVGKGICSQEDMIKQVSNEMLTSGRWYRKVAFAFLRPAQAGEIITTVVDGKEETVNTAVEGDYVVQANTRWKENYILSYATTSAAYDLDTPLEIPHGREDAQQLRKDGYRCYRSRTRIRALRATEEFLRRHCPSKKFMAKWGTPCSVEVDDIIAAQVSPSSTVTEIYRIEKTVFRVTLGEVPPQLLGGTLLHLAEGALGSSGSKLSVTVQEESRLYVVVEVPPVGPSKPGSSRGTLSSALAHHPRWLSEGEETPTWQRPVPEGGKRPPRPDLMMFSTLLRVDTPTALPEVHVNGDVPRAFAVVVKVATASVGITVSSSSNVQYERRALMEEGVTPWIDRDHKYLDVPDNLKGGVLFPGPFKDVPADTVLTVKTDASARVYVITERRSGSQGRPSWAEQLETAGWRAEESAPRWHDMATMRCLGRKCPAGWSLALPPCHAPPGEGPVFSLIVVPSAGQPTAPLEASCLCSDGEEVTASAALSFVAPEAASLGPGLELQEVPVWMQSPDATLVRADLDLSEAARRFTLRAEAPSVVYALLLKSATISSSWAEDGWEPREQAPSLRREGEEKPLPLMVLAKRCQARQLTCSPPITDTSADKEVLALVVKVDVEAFDACAECSDGLALFGSPVKEAGLLWTDRQNRLAFVSGCLRAGLVLRAPHELMTRPGHHLRLRASGACRVYVGIEATYGAEVPRNGGGLIELLLRLGWTAESVKEVSAPAWGDKTSNMRMLSRRLTEGQELEMPLRGLDPTPSEEAPLLLLLVVVSIAGAESFGKELKRSFGAWASEEGGLTAEALSTLLRVLCPLSDAERQAVVAQAMATTTGTTRKVLPPDDFVEKLLLFGSEAERRAEATSES
ncbi:unnamed protein product [Symbiodinium natans]|uniref:Uncharacterized protein n=1 Tax=Symbiodinium natans TaxID=878477 RepID=A0A812PLJ2_9DINO|nr:unnamed protein product [Symbiodinium natans]